ncbi:divergent CRAL/TRIO domain-containing protein [Scheffersomyces xylosifermentans]|uniref:divergent CRAL/TRIO domain-containing protein n=1 Tax=Scheffersomyces xylosifermentans TaxID=1304137 RepID=UPI00315D27D5
MDRIFFKTDSIDPVSNLPIYVFDTSFLPSTDVINYDAFVPTLINCLPKHPYVLIMFSCGLNKISWLWGIKFLKSFLADNINIDNLVKIISVHDSWFVKSITQILANYNFTKRNIAQLNKLVDTFMISGHEVEKHTSKNSTVIHCNTLSGLSNYVDIRQLKISLNVYKHDLLLEKDIQISMRFVPLLNPYTKIDSDSNRLFFHHFYQIFNIIDTSGDKVELLFHKPGNKVNTEIFYKCVNRNQLIWINDWDFFCISTAFKKFLMDLPCPMIPLAEITLPIKDDYSYTFQTFHRIIKNLESAEATVNYSQVLVQLFRLCSKLIRANETTKHTSTTLSKCLSHCLSHELVSTSSKDNILVVNRFLRNVLEYWPNMSSAFKKYRTVEDVVNGKDVKIYKPDDSYDLSYDVTLDEEEDADENELKFNTVNILNNNSKLTKEIRSIAVVTPTVSPVKELPATPTSISPPATLYMGSPIRSKPAKDSNKRPGITNKLTDVSNIGLQYPPQKYKFVPAKPTSKGFGHENAMVGTMNVKKTVIRGRKVSELARLFEERTQGLELLKGM